MMFYTIMTIEAFFSFLAKKLPQNRLYLYGSLETRPFVVCLVKFQCKTRLAESATVYL